MDQWYVAVNDQQYGPVPFSTLSQWVREGRVIPTTYVRRADQGQWVAAASVGGLFSADAAATAGPPPGPPPVPPALLAGPPSGGTNGQTPNGDLTARARKRLAGNWGTPIAFCLLLWLLQMGIAMVAGMIPGGALAAHILAGPFALGQVIFFLSFLRQRPVEMGMMFSGFKQFGGALAAYLLMAIFTFLLLLLLIVPGIIAALGWSQTYYVLADNPGIGGREAMRRSYALMQGRKGKLFCLGLRFLGWSLLCILTLGIGYLWLAPYMATAAACFYEDLRPPNAVDTAGSLAGGTVLHGRPGLTP